jgi:PAS domain-containing protein
MQLWFKSDKPGPANPWVIWKNGDLVQVKVVSYALEFDGKQARLGVIHDLTEQIDAELRARELEQRYRRLLEERGHEPDR